MRINQICYGLAVILCAFWGLMAAAAMSESSFVSPRTLTPRWIAGHPFTAEEVDTVSAVGDTKPSPALSYKYYRDAEGRTLTVPAKSSAYNQNLTEIVDPVAKYWYVVDAAAKVVHRSQMPPAAKPQDRKPNPDSSSLGSQFFFGVQANGSRVATSNGIVTELWFSEGLQLLIQAQISAPKTSSTRKIVSLHLGDPDPALFQVPTDYTLVSETGPFAIK